MDAGSGSVTWIGTQCAGVSTQPQERRRSGRPSSMQWRRFLIALEGFLWPRPEAGRLAKAPGATSVRVAVMKCSLGAESTDLQAHSHNSTAIGGIVAGEEHTDRTRAFKGWSTCWCSPGRHTTGCCICEPRPMRATSIVLEAPAADHCNTVSLDMIQIMEGEASGLADQALRVQQQAAQIMARLAGGRTRPQVHQLTREPIGFQRARGNAVDEHLKLRDTWAANWRANAVEPALAWPEDNGPLFHRPPTVAHLFPRGHVSGVRNGTTKDAERAARSGNRGPD